MSNCPCCSDQLLRQVHRGALSWFCRTCWSEMPNFEAVRSQIDSRLHLNITDSISQPTLKPLRPHRPQDLAA
ncbi:hypothetical protein ACKFKG_18505 [Phormidesmis sp. 146-35]